MAPSMLCVNSIDPNRPLDNSHTYIRINDLHGFDKEEARLSPLRVLSGNTCQNNVGKPHIVGRLLQAGGLGGTIDVRQLCCTYRQRHS